MKSTVWTLITALLFGCASKTQPTLTDGGAFPETDPYDHRQNPQYTEGAMAGFRSLYVDPKSYPASISPVKPPPTPPIQIEGPQIPDGVFPAIVLTADLTKLDEVNSFVSLVETISKSREGAVINMPSSGLILFPAAESEKMQARTIRRLGSMKWGSTSVNEISTIELMEALPEAAANAMIKVNPDGDENFSITLIPRPIAPIVPAMGDLLLENTSTAWAEVEINQAKVGVLGPLAHGTVANVRAGTYEIKFTLPNGYSWSQQKMTSGVH